MTATATRAPSWLGQFVLSVSAQTGLDPAVVHAWVLAEGGPPSNPLNIGPGRSYGNPAGAAAATARLINTSSYYTGVRRSTKAGPKAQLDALIASPWDAGHYRGSPNAAPGTLLYGTYKRVTHQPSDGKSLLERNHLGFLQGPGEAIVKYGTFGLGGDKGAGTKAAAATIDTAQALSDPGAIVADAKGWIADTAVTALLYLTFTIGALALILLGLSRTTGVGPGSFRAPAGYVPAAPSAQDRDDIPF